MSLDSFEKVRDFVYKCKTCGKEIPSGVANIAGHWSECTGKDFYNELMSVAADKSDITDLKKRFIK